MANGFDIIAVAQRGRLQYEALLLAASLRASAPGFGGRLVLAEPQPGGKWPGDPTIAPDIRAELEALGAEIVPFEARHFGAEYPQGNKMDALAQMPVDGGFLFLDTDTLITGDLSGLPVSANGPSASMRREATWPVPELYWPGYTAIWRSLYDMFGLEFETSLDPDQPDEYWQRYLYFNAGWVAGQDAARFGARWCEMALRIRDAPPAPLVIQPLDPWLDQVALPLVVHEQGGGRPGPDLAGLDGALSCHYRTIPLLYARESDAVVDLLEQVSAPNRIKKLLKQHDPFKRMIFQNRGHKVRALFDQNDLPRRERQIRNTIKRNGFWMR